MMNILEEAIIYATIMHQGRVRKFKSIPFILHPLEVAQILSTMTDDIIKIGPDGHWESRGSKHEKTFTPNKK
jgi:(p)ppGpp synthase/HD superfamily hydrolase